VAAIRSSRPLEERRSSRSNINDATKSLTLLPQVRRHNSLIIPQGSGSDSNLLEEEELLLTASFLTSSSIEP
jgi:hypothetical protein